ncbi:hypothetical protein R1flu_004226 [Riccia fluitans]|uniref:Uncharacterized protein n=1 Tax=Riccia fluitans TaxID=41844 RepID=A0ABD1YPP7_9MARC
MVNAIFAPVRPEHFQHNLLAFYHHAWAAITNPAAPTPDWGNAVEKTMSRQTKGLGVCNEATCLDPYLAHLYSHFHKMDVKEKEASKKDASKKCKASIQTIFDSDTKTEPDYEKEVPHVFCEDKASGSKSLDHKLDFAKWGNHVESLGRETSRLFEVFHMEIRSVTTKAMARNMKEMFALPSVVETDLQPWKEMVRNLATLLMKEKGGPKWWLSSMIILRERTGV